VLGVARLFFRRNGKTVQDSSRGNTGSLTTSMGTLLFLGSSSARTVERQRLLCEVKWKQGKGASKVLFFKTHISKGGGSQPAQRSRLLLQVWLSQSRETIATNNITGTNVPEKYLPIQIGKPEAKGSPSLSPISSTTY